MNEQLQQALAAMLNKGVQGVEASVGFLQAEIPDVIYQLLLWKAASGLFWFAFLSVLIAIIMIKGFRVAKASNDASDQYNKGFAFFIYGMAAGIPSFFMSLGALKGLSTAAQIWLAPKIYLIEYAASLAK